MDYTASQVNFTKHSKRANTYLSQTIPKNSKGMSPKLILQGHHYPNNNKKKNR